MYVLRLTCPAELVDFISAELWEAGTSGIEERQRGDSVTLAASFEFNDARAALLRNFQQHSPEWEQADPIDWVRATKEAWPARCIGERLFVATPWSAEPTPPGRSRIIQNPGLACGTGEHPCTQLALVALEKRVTRGCRVLDVGSGSGILAIAALRLGAGAAIGADVDVAALAAAQENFALNELVPALVGGSAEAIAARCSDVTVANIGGTVLASMLDDLVRITRPGGWLILTGFPHTEARFFEERFAASEVSGLEEWRCLSAKIS